MGGFVIYVTRVRTRFFGMAFLLSLGFLAFFVVSYLSLILWRYLIWIKIASP